VTFVPLEQLLQESDFVSLHMPLTAQTRDLIDEPHLRLMKPDAYLINTSRGPVVEEEGLYRVLSEGAIAGAALDVFRQEPPWGSKLLELDNVIATPHTAAKTRESQALVVDVACENVLRVLRGERPQHVVNPEVYVA
jgi:phosphoglycerate dehydrogenase-like enzyme